MGSYNLTCMVTGIGITSYMPCVVIPLVHNDYSIKTDRDFLMEKLVNADDLLIPASPLLFCRYDDRSQFYDLEGYEEYNRLVAEHFLGKDKDTSMEEFYIKYAEDNNDFNLIPISLGAYNTILKESDDKLIYPGVTYATEILWPYHDKIEEMNQYKQGKSSVFLIKIMEYLNRTEKEKHKELEKLSKIKDTESEEAKELIADYLSNIYGKYGQVTSKLMTSNAFSRSVVVLNEYYELVANSLVLYGYINSSRLGYMTTFGAGAFDSNKDEVLIQIKASQQSILDDMKSSIAWNFGEKEPHLKEVDYLEYQEDFDSDFSKVEGLDYKNNPYLLRNDLDGFINSLPFELAYKVLDSIQV